MVIDEDQQAIQSIQQKESAEQFTGIKTRHSSAAAKKKQKQQLKALEAADKESSSKHSSDEKSKAPIMEEDNEWEYSADIFKKKLEKMDHQKRKAIEDEQKLKDSQKLKEIEL